MKYLQNPKTLILLAVLVLAFATGTLDQHFHPRQPAAFMISAEALIYVFLAFVWYRLDTEQRGYRRSAGLNVAVVAFASIAIPYYLFRSRGFRGGLVAFAAFCLLIVLIIGLHYMGALAVYRYVQR